MIELKKFQQTASDQIAKRFRDYVAEPLRIGRASNLHNVPFLQMLSSITASGKTVILADAVSIIAEEQPIKPIVIWLSKGKVIVEQSYANLQPGGKYHHLIQSFEVKTLAEFDLQELMDSNKPFVYFATVGTFNQKDKEQGNLNIHRSDLDTADASTWEKLKQRIDGNGYRRPLVVVYDEAHNLTDQQTELLLELEPAGFLLASASMKLPGRLGSEVEILKQQLQWSEHDLVTEVDAIDVAESGLVKQTVLLAGYNTPMEEALDALLQDMEATAKDAVTHGLDGLPKAIYVSDTNMVAGNSLQSDNAKRPFEQRQAPPILIWRYLTEQKNVDPDDIAVYCTLKVDTNFPIPIDFHLFSGGDKDYTNFIEGNYHHIIFNLSLQEGWDDPLCYLAYIDKSMESKIQVQQVVGRLLRQPGAKSYGSERLNTAHFYVRVDAGRVFSQIIEQVEHQLKSDAPGIKIISTNKGNKDFPQTYSPFKEMTLPNLALNAPSAMAPIKTILDGMLDYRSDTVNTIANGQRTIVYRKVGGGASEEIKWEQFEHSSMVLARWIFTREIQSLYPAARGVAPTNDPKFDAVIGIGSPAEGNLRKTAREVVDTYLEHVEVDQAPDEGSVVGSFSARKSEVKAYANSLHGFYPSLNPFEHEFATSLGKSGNTWCRNPSQIGFRIPLVTLGRTRNFFPDFIVWKKDDVFLIDTKGGHLIEEAAAKKLIGITNHGVKPKLQIRLVSEGRWDKDLQMKGSDGYTIWGFNMSKGERTTQHQSSLDEVVKIILK